MLLKQLKVHLRHFKCDGKCENNELVTVMASFYWRCRARLKGHLTVISAPTARHLTKNCPKSQLPVVGIHWHITMRSTIPRKAKMCILKFPQTRQGHQCISKGRLWNFVKQVPLINTFTPKSDPFQISPAALPETLRWLYYQFLLPHIYIYLEEGWEKVLFELVCTKKLKVHQYFQTFHS